MEQIIAYSITKSNSAYLIMNTLTIVLLTLASLMDTKKREVADWLNYSLLFFALFLRAAISLVDSSFLPIIEGVTGGIIAFLISLALMYSGQWGGGDSKTMIALGIVLGFGWGNLSLLLFLIIFLLISAIYGLMWILVIFLSHPRRVLNQAALILKKRKFLRRIKMLKLISRSVAFLFLGSTLTLAALIIMARLSSALPFTAYNILLSYTSMASMFFFLAFITIWLVFFSWLFTKSVEERLMTRMINPHNLVEGDWVVSDIHVKGRVVVRADKGGIDRNDIEKLVRLSDKGSIRTVKVKIGIPFLPSFLFSFLILIFIDCYADKIPLLSVLIQHLLHLF